MTRDTRTVVLMRQMTNRTFNKTRLPPDTRSAEEKAQDGVPKNWREQNGPYNGGVGKPLLP